MLAAAGEAPCLFARGRRLEQLRREGLRVLFAGGRAIEMRLPASDRADFGVQDVVFVAVKAHSLPELLPRLSPLIGDRTAVVPLVNGIPWWYFADGTTRSAGIAAVDPDGALLELVPPERIVGCVAFVTARLTGGVISVSGELHLKIGDITGGTRPRTRALAAMLCRAGVATSVSGEIRNELWTKVALNLATNPLSVVSGATLEEQFTDPRLLAVASAILAETRRVAAAYGATLTLSQDEMIAAGLRAGQFETSMLQDYKAGRPLELGAIGQAVLELAEKAGVDMPTARLIVGLAAHRGELRLPPAAPP